jgi:CubicO group peptidase (beta-lactamase class C family)
MAFAPGTRWKYNNTGYVLLGMLVERLTGAPWAATVEARVTRPLALPSLRACDLGAVVPHRARGYEAAPAGASGAAELGRPAATVAVVPAPSFSMSHAYAAGAVCATAGDLARWSHALMAGRVVSPASLARMGTPDGAARAWRYGFGLVLDSLAGRPVLYHGGDIPGSPPRPCRCQSRGSPSPCWRTAATPTSSGWRVRSRGRCSGSPSRHRR